MSEVIFKIATTPDELSAAREIRKKVFVIEQGIPAELDLDEDEEISLHLLAIDSNLKKTIGTGRQNTGRKNRYLLPLFHVSKCFFFIKQSFAGRKYAFMRE